MTNECLYEVASNLYDGGWRSADYKQLITEYDFSEEEATAICEVLESFE